MAIPISLSLAGAATAQPAAESREPAHARLRGLSSAEAEALIGKLQEAQRRLRGGEAVFFQLLSGAPASYPMTTVSPRQAFLEISFESVASIERVPASNPLWQPFRLVVTPNGPGQMMWDVEVVLGINGQVERVEMFYTPPPPP